MPVRAEIRTVMSEDTKSVSLSHGGCQNSIYKYGNEHSTNNVTRQKALVYREFLILQEKWVPQWWLPRWTSCYVTLGDSLKGKDQNTPQDSKWRRIHEFICNQSTISTLLNESKLTERTIEFAQERRKFYSSRLGTFGDSNSSMTCGGISTLLRGAWNFALTTSPLFEVTKARTARNNSSTTSGIVLIHSCLQTHFLFAAGTKPA